MRSSLLAILLLFTACSQKSLVEECEGNFSVSRNLVELKSDKLIKWFAWRVHSDHGKNDNEIQLKIQSVYKNFKINNGDNPHKIINNYKLAIDSITSLIPEEFKGKHQIITYNKSISTNTLKQLIQSDLTLLADDYISFAIAGWSICGIRFGNWLFEHNNTDNVNTIYIPRNALYDSTNIVLDDSAHFIKNIIEIEESEIHKRLFRFKNLKKDSLKATLRYYDKLLLKYYSISFDL